MQLWVIVTLAAAAVQTVRFMLQKQLRGAGLSTWAATFSRFAFAAPLACALSAGLLAGTGTALPAFPPLFWMYAILGGLSQIIATGATVALFSERNFAVGIAFTKSETLLAALFSALILGEAVGVAGVLAIGLGALGVVVLSMPVTAGQGLRLINRASMLGLAAGLFFSLSAIGYRGATLQLDETGFFLRAALTLAAVTVMQAASMAVWLRLREPGALRQVAASWRKTALVGITGMLGSLGWFTALALQNAAYVRALGQVELAFSVLVAWFVLHEKASKREIVGIVLLAVSVVAIVLVVRR